MCKTMTRRSKFSEISGHPHQLQKGKSGKSGGRPHASQKVDQTLEYFTFQGVKASIFQKRKKKNLQRTADISLKNKPIRNLGVQKVSRKQGGRGGRLLGGSQLRRGAAPLAGRASRPCLQSCPCTGLASAPAKRRGERRGSRRTDGGKASFPHRCIAAYFNRKTRRKTYQSSFAPPSARKERGRG